jgi:hypothetical protein
MINTLFVKISNFFQQNKQNQLRQQLKEVEEQINDLAERNTCSGFNESVRLEVEVELKSCFACHYFNVKHGTGENALKCAVNPLYESLKKPFGRTECMEFSPKKIFPYSPSFDAKEMLDL